MGMIYKIRCLINGKIYVGQTTLSLKVRWAKHLHDLRDRYCAIHNALRKYGPENFKITLIEDGLNSDSELDEREKFWILKLRSSEKRFGYNRTLGGQRNFKMSLETRAKLSSSRLGSGNPMFGKRLSLEMRERMSRIRKGRPAHNKGKPNIRFDQRMLTICDETLSMAAWSRRSGTSIKLISLRLNKLGWSTIDAVWAPKRSER